MNENTICPNQEDGRHRFHIYRIADVFEQVDDRKYSVVIVNDRKLITSPLYEKVEYAYSGCNCGAARKTRITREADI